MKEAIILHQSPAMATVLVYHPGAKHHKHHPWLSEAKGLLQRAPGRVRRRASERTQTGYPPTTDTARRALAMRALPRQGAAHPETQGQQLNSP